MPYLHPIKARLQNDVPLWVAVVSGLAGVVLVLGTAGLFMLLGGPVTISFGHPEAATVPFVPANQTTNALRPTVAPPTRTSAPLTSTVTPVATTSAPPPVTVEQPPKYLKNLDTPTGGKSDVRPQTISGHRYEEGFKLYCRGTDYSPYRTSWTVSGSSRFTAVIGIADDEESALNTVARVSIQNQDGSDLLAPFEVSLGQPKTVDIAISGVVQLQILGNCRNGQNGKSDDSYVTLGDAALR